jgi:hypothetical protein
MTKRKCECPLDSPFHWKDNPRPSIFAIDPHFKAAATLSHNQTMVIERERERGKDISHFPGMSDKAAKALRINVKEFNIFTRAGFKL